MEHCLPERMNIFESVGVDKDLVHNFRISLNVVKQFVSGAAIKITDQFEMYAVTVPMSENLEIACHN